MGRCTLPILGRPRNGTLAGGAFTFATGRTKESSAPYARHLGVSAPAILCNGARIVDLERNRTLFERDLAFIRFGLTPPSRRAMLDGKD